MTRASHGCLVYSLKYHLLQKIAIDFTREAPACFSPDGPLEKTTARKKNRPGIGKVCPKNFLEAMNFPLT
jgi:hypothetical protein